MHWVIQENLFKAINYRLLTDALESLDISYTSVYIPNGTYELQPDVNNKKNVYVCGAIKLKQIAENKDWSPGSFLNENFSFDKWTVELGTELLNHDAVFGKISTINIPDDNFFIRPLEDNKAFDGTVMNKEKFLSLTQSKPYLSDIDVIASPVKDIFREYRLFYVKKRYITGSVYKVAGKPQISPEVEQSVIEYANSIVDQWVPEESFVIDISLNQDGYKVIEFNNINSSSFYACDVQKYAYAIQNAYSTA